MEEFSLISKEETDSDKPESDKKKKKRAEALGAFLVEPKPEATGREKKGADKPEKHWQALEREQAAELKVPLEKLSDEEITMVRRLSAETELAALPESAGANESPEAAYGDLLVEDFLEQVAREAVEPEAALRQTLAEAGIEEQELEAELEQPADEAPREFGEREAEIYLHEASSPNVDNDRVETPEFGDIGGAPPPPPIRPTTSGGGEDQPPRRSRKSLYDTVPGGFDPALHRVLPDRLRTEYFSNYNEAGLLDAALVGGAGGIVGYLMGRRRGRIKTEKKLLPVQKRLEKQVKGLQGELHVQETKLRKLAAQHVRARGPVVIERFKEAARARSPKAEAIESLPSQEHASEHLGHMVVIAETKPGTSHQEAIRMEKAERQQKPGETVPKVDKNVETMNRAELLELSDRIVIDGASLRQVYETRLVGERGLRRLVSEHLQGGNVKKLLRREIIEREIDFERDPAMRDQAAQGVEGGGGVSLKEMLDRAGANKTGSEEEAAFYKARAAYDSQQRSIQRRQRRLIDVSMAATIAILIVLILILLLTR